MKNLWALILVSSMILAGCATKQVANDNAVEEAAPVAEQTAPVEVEQEPAPEPPAPVAEEPAPAVKRAAEKIFFAFDSYNLTPSSQEALEANVEWLQSQPETRILIEGHADERGSEKYNLALGEKRAKAARNYLVAHGISPDRISVVSYGEQGANHGVASETVWATDRRAEFVVAN
jgi:peptidoglycan-associated lipoprotein